MHEGDAGHHLEQFTGNMVSGTDAGRRHVDVGGIGFGIGDVARALANRLGGANPIIATDINPYILSEARALARDKGLSEAIKLGQANAEALPYPDAHFDVAVCTTVLEEGDADRMLAEPTRVTRPAGRIAVLTRAIWPTFLTD